jgi:hypothetical protein
MSLIISIDWNNFFVWIYVRRWNFLQVGKMFRIMYFKSLEKLSNLGLEIILKNILKSARAMCMYYW